MAQRFDTLPDDLPIGSWVDRNGVVHRPSTSTKTQTETSPTAAAQPLKPLGETARDFGRGVLKGAASTVYEGAKAAMQVNPITGPMLLMNKAGILPDSVARFLPGYVPRDADVEMRQKLAHENKEEFAGTLIPDLVTGKLMGRVARAASLPGRAEPITETWANKLKSTMGFTEGEAAQAHAAGAGPLTPKSVEILRQEAAATTPRRNPAPINLRKIRRQEVAHQRRATPGEVENLKTRLEGELEKRTTRSPWQDVYEKTKTQTEAPARGVTLTEKLALSGVPHAKTAGAVQALLRPGPRSRIAQTLYNVGPGLQGAAGTAAGYAGAMGSRETGPGYDAIREQILQQLGGGGGGQGEPEPAFPPTSYPATEAGPSAPPEPRRPPAAGIQSPTGIQPASDAPAQRQGLADGSLLRVVHPVSGEDGVIPNTFRDIEDAKRKGWNIEVGRDATMRR